MGRFLFARLCAADLDRVGSFRTLGDLKGDLVTLAEFVELNVDELVGVEKEIFFATFDFDEPETFVGQTGDSSFLHGNENYVFGNACRNEQIIRADASRQETGVEARSVLLWIRRPFDVLNESWSFYPVNRA